MERVNLVVIMFQGNIEDVKVFKDSGDAEKFFTEQTGETYERYSERLKDEDTDTILGNYAGSNIWELKIE